MYPGFFLAMMLSHHTLTLLNVSPCSLSRSPSCPNLHLFSTTSDNTFCALYTYSGQLLCFLLYYQEHVLPDLFTSCALSFYFPTPSTLPREAPGTGEALLVCYSLPKTFLVLGPLTYIFSVLSILLCSKII